MPRNLKRHSAEFKAKVALEDVKGVKTAQQLGKDFQVHPTQIRIWKKQLTGQVAELFIRGPEETSPAVEEELLHAYEKIGRLDVEVD